MRDRTPGSVPAPAPRDDQLAGGWVKVSTTASGTTVEDSDWTTSSVTRNGLGDYTVTWSRAFAATAYALAGMVKEGTGRTKLGIKQSTELTTTSARVQVGDASGNAYESEFLTLLAVGRR